MSDNPIIIREKYKIISKIGQGKFGTVFKAVNTKIRNQSDESIINLVAIKMENNDSRVLKHETTILNYLNLNKCKNIPLVHWYGIFKNISCLVTPFYQYSLTQFIIDINNQEEEYKIIHINILMNKMLDILKNCHKLCVLHRDLKPDNFMFNHNNELILLDFGLATFINSEAHQELDNDDKKFTGNVIFASPNIHKHKKANKIDDIISVAYIYLLIYLGGKLPWMKLNGNTDIFLNENIGTENIDNQNKLNQIMNLKQIQNIYLSKTNNNNIFKFIDNAYKNTLSYKFD